MMACLSESITIESPPAVSSGSSIAGILGASKVSMKSESAAMESFTLLLYVPLSIGTLTAAIMKMKAQSISIINEFLLIRAYLRAKLQLIFIFPHPLPRFYKV